MTLIQHLMKTDLVTAEPGETVLRVSERMNRNGVGAVLIVEDGKLRGIFSERDLLDRVVVPGLDPEATQIADVMTPDPVSVSSDAHVRDCAELIRERGFRHLPVTDAGQPIGILSTRDFYEQVVQGLESFIDQARYRKDLAEGVDPYDHVGGSYGR
jgi:CBS domain-containing protein